MANPLAMAIILEWLARSKEGTSALPVNSARFRRKRSLGVGSIRRLFRPAAPLFDMTWWRASSLNNFVVS